MNNNYEIVKNVNKILEDGSTRFLDGKMQKEVSKRLKKKYKIFKSYKDAEKVIFYVEEEPKVSLLEIIPKSKIRHQDIMGSIFSLGIDSSVFGDIIIDEDKYYIYVLDSIKDYILTNLDKVGNVKIELKELELSYLEDYEHRYEEIEIISTSERIDTVISRLLHTNRDTVHKIIKDKEIILNYEIVTNNSKTLKEEDVFSIRKYGKYKYVGIINKTKKDNYIILIKKYI